MPNVNIERAQCLEYKFLCLHSKLIDMTDASEIVLKTVLHGIRREDVKSMDELSLNLN